VKQILNIAKYISAVVVIGSAALWLDARFDNQVDSNEAMIDSLEVVKRDISYNSIHLSQIDEDLQGIQDTLEDLEDMQHKQTQHIESLGWAIQNIDNFTPEQLKEILNRELKKTS